MAEAFAVMLSVLIPTHDSAAELPALLSALVPAAVDSLVREVICADGGSADATAAICEDAGAEMVAGGLVAAAQAAKSDWVLVLPVAFELAPDWAEKLAAHLRAGRRPAVMRPLSKGLLASLGGGSKGLLVQRERVAARAETWDVAALVKALGRGAARV